MGVDRLNWTYYRQIRTAFNCLAGYRSAHQRWFHWVAGSHYSNRSHQHLYKPVLTSRSYTLPSSSPSLNHTLRFRDKLLIHSLHAGPINPGGGRLLRSQGVGWFVSSSYTQPGRNIQHTAEFFYLTRFESSSNQSHLLTNSCFLAFFPYTIWVTMCTMWRFSSICVCYRAR